MRSYWRMKPLAFQQQYPTVSDISELKTRKVTNFTESWWWAIWSTITFRREDKKEWPLENSIMITRSIKLISTKELSSKPTTNSKSNNLPADVTSLSANCSSHLCILRLWEHLLMAFWDLAFLLDSILVLLSPIKVMTNKSCKSCAIPLLIKLWLRCMEAKRIPTTLKISTLSSIFHLHPLPSYNDQ